MAKTQIVVHREVTQPLHDGDILCLQEVTYFYGREEDGSDEGFRFIRRTEKGNMRAQRGQANVVSLGMIKHMIANAEKAWPYDRHGKPNLDLP